MDRRRALLGKGLPLRIKVVTLLEERGTVAGVNPLIDHPLRWASRLPER
jgi:hypothetical protein